MIPLALALAAQLFTLEGRIVPKSTGSVTLHSSTTPFTASTLANVDGSFRFRRIEPGTYTLVVFQSNRGETRMSVDIGPSAADRKGRVRLTVDVAGGALSRERAHMVSANELSVPERARREYSQAMARLGRRDADAAVKHLERAVEIAPDFAAAWNHLGTIAYQTKRYGEAEQYFRRALQADEDLYEALVNLGGVLVTTGQYDEAWKVNVGAVALKPTDPLAHSQLGMTYLILGKLDLAEKHLREAVTLDPGHFSHPQLQLAEVYRRRKEMGRAAEQLESFLRYHPDDPAAPKIRELLKKWR